MSSTTSLASAITFGDLLKGLRRRAGLTQGELATRVGFSSAQISRLEQNQRLPDPATISAKFAPALDLGDEPRLAQRLLELAADARGERLPTAQRVHQTIRTEIHEEVLEGEVHLPAPPTTLVGRAREVATVTQRLIEAPGRLLTLVGPPGVGKTRLAVAAAARLQDMFAHGVYFIPLAAISEPDHVIVALANELGVVESAAKPLKSRVVEFLRRKELLLVLDNFEQVTGAAPLLAELLEQSAGLRLLVTSRAPLHLRAEQRFKVQPLVPAAAVELFIQRAQACDPDFATSTDAVAPIAEICLRLDCLPLAIELVAARSDLFSAQQLLAQLQERRLDLLSASALRDLSPRHQTLRAAIGWSYDLLTPVAQQLFARLGSFVGGFDGEAATFVASAAGENNDLTADACLPLLTALYDRNLVQKQANQQGLRFVLLETIREFAHERLLANGEAETIRCRHADYFLALAEAAARAMQGQDKKHALDQLEQEHENLRAALKFYLATDAQSALRLTAALHEFWYTRGYFSEGRYWLTQALAMSTAPTVARAYALLASGQLAASQAEYAQALPPIEESIALFRTLEDQLGLADALRESGWVFFNLHDRPQTIARFEASLVLARALAHKAKIASALTALSHVLMGDPHAATQVYAYVAESLALARTVGEPGALAFVLRQKAELETLAGDYAAATLLLTEALALHQAVDGKREIAWTLNGLGEAAWLQGQGPVARNYLTEAQTRFLALGEKDGVMITLHHLGQVERTAGNGAAALACYTHSLTMALDLENCHMMARGLAGVGGVALAQAQYAPAAQLLAAAQTIFAGLAPFLAPADQAEYAQMVAAVRTVLGETNFEMVWARGMALARAEAVAYALAYKAAIV